MRGDRDRSGVGEAHGVVDPHLDGGAVRAAAEVRVGDAARAGALYGLAHFAVALTAPLLAVETSGVPSVMLGGGLLLAVLTRVERRRWWVLAAIALLAELAAASLPPLRAVGGSFARAYAVAGPVHVLGALLGAFLLESFVAQPLRLTRVPAVAGLVLLACALATGAAALIGAALLRWNGTDLGVPEAWRAWWLADAVGALTVAPVVLAAWSGREPVPRVTSEDAPGGALELGLTATAALLATATSAFGGAHAAWLVTLIPVLAWNAVRFAGVAAVLPAAACAVLLSAATAWGHGPFAGDPARLSGGVPGGAVALQGFVALALATALLVGAAAAERVRATRRRQQAETRLEALLRLEETHRHVAGIAHDFSNVNMALDGNLDLLRMRGVPEGSERFVQALANAIESAQVLVGRLMNSPGSAERMRDCDLARLTAEVTGRLRGSLADGVELSLEHSPEPILTFLDPLAFDRILTNLVRNAAEAVDGRGRITVAVGRERGDAVLEVRDDGRGMDESTQSRVFDPFFTTKGTRGSGIGLWSVRQLVEEGGGSVAVRSRLHEGATFTVRWPVSMQAGG